MPDIKGPTTTFYQRWLAQIRANKAVSCVLDLMKPESDYSDADKDGYFDSGMWAAKRETDAEIAKLRAECDRLTELTHVPGQWQCAKCNFVVCQRTLNAHTGVVGVNDQPGETCPNCRTVLWRMSWKQEAEELEQRCIEQMDARREAEAKIETAVNDFIAKVAKVTTDLGWQAGEPAIELAGHIISVLVVHPEQTSRFMAEGGELFIDGTFNAENGSLTYRTADGRIFHPSVLRKSQGSQQ